MPVLPWRQRGRSSALETTSDGKWLVRVAQPLPAFFGEDQMTVRTLGPVHVQAAASGIHEILVLAPEHYGSWADLDDPPRAGDGGPADRLEDRAPPAVRYTQAIVNQGREAGAR